MRLAKLMGLSVGLFLISFELFAQAPKEFNVTGGGSYCAGGAGLPVGLDGSELGVTYTLNKNGVPQVPTVPGTGLPITFGNQLFGTYTVTGANLFGTTAMKGNAEIKEEPNLPVGVSIVASANPVCADASVTFTATPVNGGTTPVYQWYRNGSPVGTNSPIYTVTPSNNDQVYVVMTSSLTCTTGNPATSNTITMTVNTNLPVGVSIVASANPVCAGTSVTFTATPVNGGTTPVYQWYRNGSPVGTNSPTYTVTPSNNDQVYVVMTSSLTCTTGNPATSNTITMTVNPNLPVSVSITASENPVCNGTSVTFTATPVNGGTSPVYQWYRNGSPVGSNSPVFTYTPNNNDQIYVVLTSSLTCTSGNPATSNTIRMTVSNRLPVSVTITASANPVCAGTSVTFTATPVNGGTTPAYQWYRNGTAVGTNSPTYTYTPSNNDQVYVVMTSSLTCTSGNPATSNTITMTVNSNLPVSVTISASANPVCAGTSVTFTATPVNGGTTPVYQWYRNGTAVGTNSSTYTYAPSNNDQIYVVLTSSLTCTSGNPATSNIITMTVNPVPEATASNNGPVCTGTPLNLTGGPAGMASYAWTGPNSFTSNQQSPVVSTSATLAMAGTYTLTVTSSNGCQAVATTNVVVYTAPVANAGTGGNECDLNFTFNAVPSVGTGTWFKTAGPGNATYSPNANSPTATVTVTAYGSYIFTWTEVNGTCSSAASIIVNFNQPPVANGGSGGNECDLNFVLNATPPVAGTGSWSQTSGPGTSVFSPNASTPNATVTVSAYGRYRFLWTVINGTCTDTAAITVNFYQQPLANAGPGGNECDLNFVFSAVPSIGTGTWTRVSGTGTATFSPNANSPTATVTVSAYGAYVFRWTEVNGTCTSSDTLTVRFSQQPVANAGAGGNECDLNFRFSAVPSIGTGLWTLTSGPGTAVFTPNAATYNATVTVSAYGTYVFTWTETNNNCTSSAPVTVNFYQQPVANAGTGGNNCGPDFNLKAVPSVGTGTWTRVSGPGTATFSPNANSPTAKVTVSAYGTYVFRWTEVNGTCTSSSTVSVTFIQQPSADAGNGGDECDKDFQLNAKPNGGTGTWSKISGPGDVTFTPNASTYNAKVTVTQFGEYDFAWTETNSTCTSSDIIRVTFHDKPAISAGEDVPACEQGSVQLRATGEGTGGTYLWSPANLLNNPNIANPIASPLVTTVFTVTYTDQFGCSNSDRVTVEVRKRPVAKAGPDQTLDYIFETDMEAVLDYAYEIGKWTVLEGTGELENENSPTTHVSNLSLGRNRILWTVTNDACPAVNDTVNIIVNNLAIPTLITPNLDGKNDFFVIRGIETLGKCELVIFNRWGAEVYKNSDYDNSWDGKDDKGNDLPPETYFFIFKPEKSRALSGYIVIRR